MPGPVLLLELLALLVVANGAPVIAARLFGRHLSAPLDGRRTLGDGRPLFGKSKTVRGILASLGCTALVAPLFSLDWTLGLLLAAGAMAGDLASSFVKRRIGLEPHARVFGLDHGPEALVPLLLVQASLGLGWADVAVVVGAFVLGAGALSRLLSRLGIRQRPY